VTMDTESVLWIRQHDVDRQCINLWWLPFATGTYHCGQYTASVANRTGESTCRSNHSLQLGGVHYLKWRLTWNTMRKYAENLYILCYRSLKTRDCE